MNYRGLIWRALLYLNGSTLQHLRVLEASASAGWPEVLEQQQRRLAILLCHAIENVPYYRSLFRGMGLSDGDDPSISDAFLHLPLLDKQIIKVHGVDLTSSDLPTRKWQYNTSGGSTGQPVRFIQDKEYLEWNRAKKLLFDGWTGFSPGDRKVVMWGSEQDIVSGKEKPRVRFRQWLLNETFLNTFYVTSEEYAHFIQALNRIRPVQVLAYVENVYDMARLINREGIKIHPPRSVLSTAGTLTPEMREEIEETFQCPVYNRYGSREVGDVACEYGDGAGLYVSPLTHFVEILRPDGTPCEPGEVGEIVVTLLTNYAMPLIRYRIGDMAAWADDNDTSKAALSWPRLKEVTGRMINIFRTRDGAQVHGQYFLHLFYFRDWVFRFQVIQEDFEEVVVKIVSDADHPACEAEKRKDIADIEEKIKLVMGERCRVHFEFTQHIEPSASGKFLYTISKVQPDHLLSGTPLASVSP